MPLFKDQFLNKEKKNKSHCVIIILSMNEWMILNNTKLNESTNWKKNKIEEEMNIWMSNLPNRIT